MTLHELNQLPTGALEIELRKCCGSTTWVKQMVSKFPVKNLDQLLNQCDEVWENCTPEDAKEAFLHHPKIGDIHKLHEKFAETASWAAGEQAGINNTTVPVLEALAESNRVYEEKFGYIFIVCANGMSAEEMLSLLTLRLLNNPEEEMEIAMEEQNKISRLRLKKMVS